MVLYKKKGGRFGQKADLDEILRVNITVKGRCKSVLSESNVESSNGV
jgi:hypothetical protein